MALKSGTMIEDIMIDRVFIGSCTNARLEDFYRHTRVLHSVLVDAHDEPIGGAWNFDADNRQSPPKNQTKLDLKKAYYPTEDEIDKIARKKINSSNSN